MDGFDLLAYRYKYQNKVPELISRLKKEISIPIVVAGSIASFERLQEIINAEVWAFTIGSAFFEKTFVKGGSYRENVNSVYERLE